MPQDDEIKFVDSIREVDIDIGGGRTVKALVTFERSYRVPGIDRDLTKAEYDDWKESQHGDVHAGR